MAYDLIVWKWADDEPGDPAEVVSALNDDESHPSITRFDVASFESAIRARFGDVNDDPSGPFLYEVSDFSGTPANWVDFAVNWSQVGNVCPIIAEIARSQGLAICDPQEGAML